MANGDRMPCEGVARQVALAIGSEVFTIDCFGISLGEFDLILGVEFLRTLGPILWDFEDLCMAFTRGSRHIMWKGLGSSRDDIREPAVRAVQALLGQPLLDRLLPQFEQVFDAPQGLPPARPYDHRIHLLPGTVPIAVRPYRYPQLQKGLSALARLQFLRRFSWCARQTSPRGSASTIARSTRRSPRTNF